MSYQVIARKWRPQTFDEVTGQDHVTTALRNAIRSDRVPHAILLTGPRGVGKTTLARLLARSLNCEKGPTDSPCGTCISCEEILSGRSTDVQEVDAASHTGVDDVRELIEAIRYAASPGKYRIFVVDEVHMLSRPAFNALLKTLEEPPPQSLFVLATTNPEKIPFTVVSRCQRYDLRRIATTEVVARLRLICEAEGVGISAASLLAIARAGEGSMRDSQTLLDQLIAYGGSEVSDETVTEVLDLTDRRVLIAIAAACIAGDGAAALEACALALEGSSDAKRISTELLSLLRDLVVLRIAPDRDGLVEGGEADIAELRELAQRTDATRLRRMFRALVKEQEDLAWAPQPSAVLEMAVIRLATQPPSDDVARLLARLDQLERPGGGSAGPSGGGGGGGRSGSSAAAPAARKRAPKDPSSQQRSKPAQDEALSEVFAALHAFASGRDRGTFAALEGARLVAREPGSLRIAASHAFQARRLQDRLPALNEMCSDFLGEPTRVSIESVEANDDKANVGPRTRARAAERRQRKEALEHPALNSALEILEAEIVEIRPLGGQ